MDKNRTFSRLRWAVMVVTAFVLWHPGATMAREAAFVEPTAGSASKGASAEALVADPKSFDAGDAVVGLTRVATVFFVNQSSKATEIEDIVVTGDSNVTSEIVGDDCRKIGKLPVGSRCAVTLSITPTTPGFWTVQLLVTHDGTGRIAKSEITGKTLGENKSDAEHMGLALSSQKVEPIDFGEVEINLGEAVRTALVNNDSNEDLKVIAIDLVAEGRGLERMTQGCAVDTILKSGESCPITLRWTPKSRGDISTDLIVRHSGRVGFMVVPVRGKTLGEDQETGASGSSHAADKFALPDNKTDMARGTPNDEILPPELDEIQKITQNLPKLDVGTGISPPSGAPGAVDDISLIGTVGDSAILQRGGTTRVVARGGSADFDGAAVKVLAVAPKSVRIDVNGTPRNLELGLTPRKIETQDGQMAQGEALPKNGKKNGTSSPAKLISPDSLGKGGA